MKSAYVKKLLPLTLCLLWVFSLLFTVLPAKRVSAVEQTGATESAQFLKEQELDIALPLANPDKQPANINPASVAEQGVVKSAHTAQDEETCETTVGYLGFMLCPVIRMLDAGIREVDEKLIDLLEVPEDNFSDVRMQNAARRVRNFAYIILFPIMLVMVTSTALGFDFISAYTLKKALPRLVAAIIFIALSGPITLFMVDLANVIGRGIGGLILQPFLGSGAVTLSSLLTPTQGNGASAAVVGGGFVSLIVLGPGAVGIALSYAFVTFLALFAGFAVLALRQVLILVLALLAPLAILSWIFPGNDKLWKLWWGSFTKLLIMFPLIVLLITSGKVFASIVSTNQAGLLGAIIAITAYIGPYFFIPATFKFAGGMFATISGGITNKGKGLFEGQKAARAKIAGQSYQDFKGGTKGGKWNPRRAASMNIGRRVGAGMKGRYGIGATGKASMALQSDAEPEEIAKENHAFAQSVMVDEEVAASVSLGNDVDKMMKLKHFNDKGIEHTRSVAARGRAVGNSRRTQVAAAKQLSKTGKVLANAEEARQVWASAGGGDAGLTAGLKETMKYNSRGVGRNDIGRTTSGTDAEGRPIEISNRTESLREMSVNDLSRMKPLGIQGMFGDADEITYAMSSGQMDAAEKEQALRVLYSAEVSPYLQPQQQAQVKKSLDSMRRNGNIEPELHNRLIAETRRGVGDAETNQQFNPPDA